MIIERASTYEVEEGTQRHDRGPSEVRVDLPELANRRELSDHLVVSDVSLAQISLLILLLLLARLLHHGPDLVRVL